MIPDKILCVDDEQNVLNALHRQLRKLFSIDTAESGVEALRKIQEDGPYAVVVSDLRMPGMDGIELLDRIRKYDSSIIRIVLSGNSDLQTAVEAVNTGQVFRFLTKPCSLNGLKTALRLALRHYELVHIEKDLLDRTLKGSISMLSEIMSVSNPRAFSRGYRVRKIVVSLAKVMEKKKTWRLELAALLSQVGCIAVPEDILKKVARGNKLTDKEERIYNDHPRVGGHLVGKVPRLEGVAEIIRNQLSFDCEPENCSQGKDQYVDLLILQAALEYDRMRACGLEHGEIFSMLFKENGRYHPDILNHLREIEFLDEKVMDVVSLLFDEIIPGMVAAEDICTKDGVKIIEKGQEITWPTIQGLQNFIDHIGIREPIKVWAEQ